MSQQPSEKTTGLRALFSVPSLYRLTQWAVGADSFRSVIASEVLDLSADDRVLDVGCGTGDILDHLPTIDYLGVDPNPDYILAARNDLVIEAAS